MDLGELEADRIRNRQQRLDFVVWYAQWVKRTPNSIWSKQQKDFIDSVVKNADKMAKEGIRIKVTKGSREQGVGNR